MYAVSPTGMVSATGSSAVPMIGAPSAVWKCLPKPKNLGLKSLRPASSPQKPARWWNVCHSGITEYGTQTRSCW